MEHGVGKNASRLHTFIKDVTPTPPGISYPRPAWVHSWKPPPNRCWSLLLRNAPWGMASSREGTARVRQVEGSSRVEYGGL